MILVMDDVDMHQSFICLKIDFPLSKPIETGFNYFWEDGGSVWIGFKYEWLSSFGLHCGLIDHTIDACCKNPPHPLNFALTKKLRCNSPMVQSGEQWWGGVQGPIIMVSWQQPTLPRTPLAALDGVRPLVSSLKFQAGIARVLGASHILISCCSDGS